MYGLSFRIVLSVYLRLPIYQDRLLFPETLLSTSHDFQSVLWVSSPTLLQALQESHDLALAKDKVLAIVSSGGALASHSKSFLTEKICPNVLEIYGSTETGVVAYRLDKVNWQFFNSVKHQETEQGLLIESAWCMEPQLLADAIVWHGSGFELLGRLDRIIKLADKRISLLQLEHQLLQHPYLADVHVVKHPEGSHLAAWVALNEFGIQAWKDNGRKLVIQALKQHIQGQQDKIAIPRHWRFAMTLPRNAQSKLKQIDVENAILQPITEPTVLQQHAVAEHEYHVRLQVPLDLQYFNGHFDSFHLVPGVVQIKWILKLLQQFNWLQGSPRQFENLKFQHFLRPCDVMDVQFKRDMVRQKMTYQCTIGETKIASGRLCIPNGKGGEA
jgi:3-hydroxymyristoyl/3-hydroxydecanoyl-(acyl carrier protein) dehydratase